MYIFNFLNGINNIWFWFRYTRSFVYIGMYNSAFKIPGSNSAVKIISGAKTIPNETMQDRMTQASLSDWSEINTSWKAGIGPALFTSLDFKFSYNIGGLGVLSLMYQNDLGAIKVNGFCRFQSLYQNATTGIWCKLQTSNASFLIHFKFSGVIYINVPVMVIMCFFIILKSIIQKLMSFPRFTSWTIDLFTEHRPMEFRPYDIL